MDIDKVYPTLPSAPPENGGQEYRLQKISEIQPILETVKEKREAHSKKYHKAVKIVDNFDVALIGVTVGLGVGGVGLLSTIVAAPIVVVMEGIAIGTGALSIAGKYVTKKCSAKAEKHEKIKTLDLSKLNTISSHISKAFADNKVSDEEFQLILEELERYRTMKEEVRVEKISSATISANPLSTEGEKKLVSPFVSWLISIKIKPKIGFKMEFKTGLEIEFKTAFKICSVFKKRYVFFKNYRP